MDDCQIQDTYIDGLVQERRNSSALAMELRLSSTNPSIYGAKLSSHCGVTASARICAPTEIFGRTSPSNQSVEVVWQTMNIDHSHIDGLV